ncbi:MAG: hypothetical protein P8188_13580 [Gemmatimonadota bacterium]
MTSATADARRPQPSPLRIFVVMAAVLATLAGLTVFAARMPASLPGYAAALGCGIAVTMIFFSVWEWTFHRYLYHRILVPALRPIFLTHHRDHHFRFYPPWRFTDDEIVDGSHQSHPSVWLRVVRRFVGENVSIPDRWVYLVVGLVLIVTPGWLVTRSVVFCLGVAATGVTLFQLFGRVHGTIHRPGAHPLVEAQPWYPFLERHHYIHHVDPEANENFLVPLADWLFGTLRTSLTEAEEAKVEEFRLRHADSDHG